jgi:hypothetical protein
MRRDSPASGRCPQFTEDHEAFRELARDFVEKEVVRAYPEWEKGGRMPLNFVVTDIQPAPANLAGTTLATTGTFHQRSAPRADRADRPGRALADHPRHRNDRAGRVLVLRQPPLSCLRTAHLSRPTVLF